MVDMAIHQILPAAMHYTKSLCESLTLKKQVGIMGHAEMMLVRQLSEYADCLYDAIEILRNALQNVPKDAEAASRYYHDTIVPGMKAVRAQADQLEMLTDKSYWPYPTYSDLLYY